MSDGPNHKLNFERGILNAKNNLHFIVKYLRSNSVETNYKEYLDMYVPKLEGTEYYDEFKADLDALNAPKKEKKETLTEEEFLALSAEEQKALITVTEENNGSNAEKRLALYLSNHES